MTSELPKIVDRTEQPYVAIRKVVTLQTFPEIADRLQDVFGWLGARGIEPAGAPFFKYNVIDMERRLEVEAGVPIPAAADGADGVACGVLPAGHYATVTHAGHPDGLFGATAALLEWAAGKGLAWDMTETADGEKWGCRLEIYKSDPREEPDMAKWETDLAFKLA